MTLLKHKRGHLREILIQTLPYKKRTVQLWQDHQNQKKTFFYDFTYEKGMHAHKYLHFFFTTESGSYVGKKCDERLWIRILHELEYILGLRIRENVSKSC